MPAPFEAVYGASKALHTSFAQALRNEMKDTPITVTVLMAGATQTSSCRTPSQAVGGGSAQPK
jgi:short-subunit dehydrogenase